MKAANYLFVAIGLIGGGRVSAETLVCVILPSQVVEVGSSVVGILETVNVDRGETVHKDQIIAQLTSDIERAAVAVAKARSRNTAELEGARTSQDFAKRRQTRADDLYKQQFVSSQFQDQAATEAAVARRKLMHAEEQRELSARELTLVRAQLSQRLITSPISGVVMERYLSPGERVEEKPILKLAALDPLRVEVIVPSTRFSNVQVGMMATVTPDLPGIAPQQAKVTLVDRVIDPASNTFRVRLELPNPNNALPAGLRCKIALSLKKPQPAQARSTPDPAPVPRVAPARLHVESAVQLLTPHTPAVRKQRPIDQPSPARLVRE